MTVHKVVWHENAIRGAIERAQEATALTDPDDTCSMSWLDLACLLDIARTWVREQEAL